MKRARAEILSTRRVGAYRSITLVAPEIAERSRPGQFLAIAMPEGRAFILRRHFSIHQASRHGGWAGTLEFVVDPSVGAGTGWLAGAGAHEFLDVIGPLGKAFSYPKRLTNCLLLAEGRGAASLFFLAQELVARHKRVDMILGGRTLESVFKPVDAKRLSQTVVVMTADGSLGERGGILDALPDAVARADAEVVYAVAPAPTLRSIAAFCREHRLPAQVAIEERMGCGFGLCNTCVVPVATKDRSAYENLRACVDGPVFDPSRILWDRWLGELPIVPPTAEPVPAIPHGGGEP
ncbi:MAG: dihydroorotate dehydrogenase electron transfer subunit [Actinobacteria bacterium]|nr:MAG: dihydroorotate dehydrogenase electron transfer subunit [Actinomycetota bacterium]